MKKLFALFMALVMTMSLSGALAISTDYKDWSSWPVANGDITIDIGMAFAGGVTDIDPADTWLWQWGSEKSGLKFNFETVLADARGEKKSLMFASDDLPDVLWRFGLTPTELVKYGMDEGQLMPLNEYITDEIMPNLSAWIRAYPEVLKNITAPDGNIYTLPVLTKILRSAGNATRIFISDMYLNELGLEKPKTLDEMNEALYAFKKAYPDKTPIGASAACYDIRDFFLNALGYLTAGDNDFGMGIAIRDGELVIPCADESFLEFLTLMNKYYQDGIINQDYFLLDSATVQAGLQANENMLQEASDIGSTYEDWKKWSAQNPLTSAYNEEAIWLSPNLFGMGNLALSSYCEHPVEFLKYMDFFYSDLAIVWIWYGPIQGHADAEGYENVGWFWNEGDTLKLVGVENGTYSGEWENGLNTCNPAGMVVGNNAYALTQPELTCAYDVMKAIAGHENTSFEWDVTGNIDNYFRSSMEQNISPYESTDFPFYVYFTSEQTARVAELETVIKPYVQTEVAEFITGARPLNEFPQFVEELEGMGIREYEQLYRDATGR